MKKIFSLVAASALLSTAGLVSAAEPVQLDDAQMDAVSASGYSGAGGYSTALFGTAVSNSSSTNTTTFFFNRTTANSFNLASGLVVTATSSAEAY